MVGYFENTDEMSLYVAEARKQPNTSTCKKC